MVDHNILLMKLEKYGINGMALQWFRDYQSNRTQYVTYNNHMSTKDKITCGVPQSAILCPLLVLLCISDFSDNIHLFERNFRNYLFNKKHTKS